MDGFLLYLERTARNAECKDNSRVINHPAKDKAPGPEGYTNDCFKTMKKY